MAETRKIAAILAADVVGFSRMTSADEDSTLARLRILRADLIDPTVASQNGRVFKWTGDGAMVEFRSVVEAVRCGVAIQNAMIERNARASIDQCFEFRIGIHLGDVVEEADGDVMGDGVNIAARLEGIAKPGAICLSEDAYRQVKARLDLTVTDLGLVQLKNLSEPIRAYSLEVGNRVQAKPAPAPITEDPSAPHLSLVVLPFANLGGGEEQDYFADGITENLTTDLSRFRGAFVIGRNTAFTFKGKSVDLKQIGRELNVRYVLEGSVQRGGNRVRVNAQLIDAETGHHLWAERFDKPLADLFDMQDEIVARLTNTLNFRLTAAEAQRTERASRSGNLDAFDFVMRGRALTFQFAQLPTKENCNALRAAYQQALAIDPNDAAALAGDACSYLFEMSFGWMDSRTDYNAKLLNQAERSIALAREEPMGHLVKSYYLTAVGRLDESLRAADAGLAIFPNDSLLHAARGLAEIYLGLFERGKASVRQAMRLSPRDPFLGQWHNYLCCAELGLGHCDAAIREGQLALDAGYRIFLVHAFLAAAYALNGDMVTAKAALDEACRINPALTFPFMGTRYANIPTLLRGLRIAGLAGP